MTTATFFENGPTVSTSLPSATSATIFDDAVGRLVAEELRRADAVGDRLEHAFDRDLARALKLAARALLGHRALEAGFVDVDALLPSAMTRVRSSGKPYVS